MPQKKVELAAKEVLSKHNARLHQTLLEAENDLLDAYAAYFTLGPQKMKDKFARAAEAFRLYETGYSLSVSVDTPMSEVLVSCKVELSPRGLGMRRAELEGKHIGLEAVEDMCLGLLSARQTQDTPMLDEALRYMLRQVEAVQLVMSSSPPIDTTVLQEALRPLLREVAAMKKRDFHPPARRKAGGQEERIAVLYDDYQKCCRRGDMEVAREAVDSLLQLLREIYTEGMEHLSSIKRLLDECLSVREKSFDLLGTFTRATRRLKEGNRNMMHRICADLSAVDGSLAERKELLESRMKEAAVQRSEAARCVQEFEEAILAKGHQMYAARFSEGRRVHAEEMLELGRRRRELVLDAAAEVASVELEQVRGAQFASHAQHHSAALNEAKRQCKAFQQCTGLLEQGASRLCRAIAADAATAERRLVAIQVEVSGEVGEVARKLIFAGRSLMERLLAVAASLHEAHTKEMVQLELCNESFDPLAKRHAIESRHLANSLASVTEEITSLESQLQGVQIPEVTSEGLESPDEEWERVLEMTKARRVEMEAYLRKSEESRIHAEREFIRRSVSQRPTSRLTPCVIKPVKEVTGSAEEVVYDDALVDRLLHDDLEA
eukprot:Sspe_Gene.87129::Locus_58065_Transcript_3_3_Confidence_0.600_Length_1950::g.87129::m.87129